MPRGDNAQIGKKGFQPTNKGRVSPPVAPKNLMTSPPTLDEKTLEEYSGAILAQSEAILEKLRNLPEESENLDQVQPGESSEYMDRVLREEEATKSQAAVDYDAELRATFDNYVEGTATMGDRYDSKDYEAVLQYASTEEGYERVNKLLAKNLPENSRDALTLVLSEVDSNRDMYLGYRQIEIESRQYLKSAEFHDKREEQELRDALDSNEITRSSLDQETVAVRSIFVNSRVDPNFPYLYSQIADSTISNGRVVGSHMSEVLLKDTEVFFFVVNKTEAEDCGFHGLPKDEYSSNPTLVYRIENCHLKGVHVDRGTLNGVNAENVRIYRSEVSESFCSGGKISTSRFTQGKMYDNAIVEDRASVHKTEMRDSARVSGEPFGSQKPASDSEPTRVCSVSESKLSGNAQVCGNAWVHNSNLSGDVIINSGRVTDVTLDAGYIGPSAKIDDQNEIETYYHNNTVVTKYRTDSLSPQKFWAYGVANFDATTLQWNVQEYTRKKDLPQELQNLV